MILNTFCRRIFSSAFVLLAVSVVAVAQNPHINYLIPDAGAPGMCVQVDFISSKDSSFAFALDEAFSTSIQVQLVRSDDSSRVRFGPVVVRYYGRLLHTIVFINPNAAPGPIPVRIRQGNKVGNVDTFFIKNPEHIGALNGGYARIGDGTAGHGRRTKRGTIVADSLVLTSGTYGFNTTDLDVIPGNVSYLPVTVLLTGKFSLDNLSNLRADANGVDGGPGGGGGQGNNVLLTCPTPPVVLSPGNGFSGGTATGGGTSGVGTSLGGKSLSDVVATLSGGPSSPFDDGLNGGGGGIGTVNTGSTAGGGGGGGSAFGGGSGNSGVPSNASYPVGSPDAVPLTGGGGGGTGAAFGALCPASGAGGGGGGAVLIVADSGMEINGDVTANGGVGGQAQCTDANANSGGGGGGGGGAFLFASPRQIINATGRVSTVGGPSGGPCGAGFGGGQGGDGKTRVDGPLSGDGSNVGTFTPLVHFRGPTIAPSSLSQQTLDTIKGTGNALDSIYVWLMNNQNGIRRAVGPFKSTVDAQGTFSIYVAKDSLKRATADSLVTIVSAQTSQDLYNSTSTWVMGPASARIISLPHGQLTPMDTSVDFGTIQTGNSVNVQIPLTNTGTRPMTIIAIQPVYTFGQNIFTVVSPALPKTVSVGGTVILVVKCSPADTGLVSDSIAVITGDIGTVTTFVRISGSSFLPQLTATTSLKYGLALVNGIRLQNVVVKNAGTLPASLTAIRMSGLNSAEFYSALITPISILAHDSLVIPITFAPKTPGPKEANCQLQIDDSAIVFNVALTGTGSSDAIITPAKVCVPISVTGDTTVTICNALDSALKITNVAVNPSSVGFSITPCDIVIPKGGCANVCLHYVDAGTATLVVTCAGIPPLSIPVTSDCNAGVNEQPMIPHTVFDVYPNPCVLCPAIQIAVRDAVSGSIGKATMVDMLGRSVLDLKAGETAMNVDGLPAGMYAIRIVKTGKTTMVPFVVMK